MRTLLSSLLLSCMLAVVCLSAGLASSPVLAAGPGDGTTGADILAAPGIDEPPLLDLPDAQSARARAKDISQRLRCPVCQALSVADSNSDTARAMAERIEGFVAAGYSDEQIVDYFTDTYGEWVRLDPEKGGVNAVLWFLPVGFLIVGALGLAATTRKTAPGEHADASSVPSASSDDPYRARILAELGEAPEAAVPRSAAPAQPPNASPDTEEAS